MSNMRRVPPTTHPSKDSPHSKTFQRSALAHLANALAKDDKFKRRLMSNRLIVAEIRHWLHHRREGASLVHPSRSTRLRWIDGSGKQLTAVKEHTRWLREKGALVDVIATPAGRGNPSYVWLDIGAVIGGLADDGAKLGNSLLEKFDTLAEAYSHPEDFSVISQVVEAHKRGAEESCKRGAEVYRKCVEALNSDDAKRGCDSPQIGTTYLYYGASVAPDSQNEVLEANVASARIDAGTPDEEAEKVSKNAQLRVSASGADSRDGRHDADTSLASPGQRPAQLSPKPPRKTGENFFAENTSDLPPASRATPTADQDPAVGEGAPSDQIILKKNERAEASGSAGGIETAAPGETIATARQQPQPRVIPIRVSRRPQLIAQANGCLALVASEPDREPHHPAHDPEHAAALQRWTDGQTAIARQAIEDWQNDRIPAHELWK